MTLRLILLAALVLAACGPASALDQPRLKAMVTVSSDLVRLGDLVDGAGAAADEALFQAPDIGTTGTVQASRILAAARSRLALDIDAAGVREVSVTRAGRVIGLDEVGSTLAAALEARGHANLTFTFDPGVRPVHVEPHLDQSLRVERLDWIPASGRFEAVLSLDGSAVLKKAPLRIGGLAVESVEVPVFTRTLTRGEVLRDGDVAMERRPKTQAQTAATASLTAALGKAVKRPARAGQLVLAADLMKPEVVVRNDAVTLVYETPGMVLTVRAKALATGAEGDTISVLNAQSSRVVEATVTGPGRVTVAAAPRIVLQ